MTDTTKRRNWTKRIGFYALGIVAMAFGLSMTVRTGIGTPPAGAISYALSKLTPMSIGMCNTLFHIFCLLVQIIIKRQLTLKLVLQLPMAYVFGLLIDIFYGLLNISFSSFFGSLLFLIAGLLIFALGIRIVVGADVLLVPVDGLMKTIGNIFGWPTSKAKLIFDIAAATVTVLMTLIAAGDPFLAIGVGTVICVAGTGPAIGLYTKLFPFFDVGKNKDA